MKDFLDKAFKFYLVGASGVIVNLGIVYLLTHFFSVYYIISNMIGIAVSVTTNFMGNKLWTFSKIRKQHHIFRQYVYYWISNLIGITLQLLLTYTLVEFFGVWYILATFIAIFIASLTNFIINKTWTFRDLSV